MEPTSVEVEARWERWGREVFAPLLGGFVHWLQVRVRGEGAKAVWFCLRDGELPAVLYEVLRAGDPELPEARRLPASRRAFGVAALGARVLPDQDFLLVSAHARPVREFVERLGVEAERVAPAFAAVGFGSLEEVVDHRGRADRVAALLRHPLVLAALQRRAAVERVWLLRYLEQEGFLSVPAGETVLVDLGWKGTVQKCLVAVLEEERPAWLLAGGGAGPWGAYLATQRGVEAPSMPAYRAAGYVVDRGRPEDLAERVDRHREVLEVVCTEPAGSVLRFAKGAGGRVEALRAPLEVEPAQVACVAALHRGVVAAVAEMARGERGYPPTPAEAVAPFLRWVEAPTAEEAAAWGGLRFGENLGGARVAELRSYRRP